MSADGSLMNDPLLDAGFMYTGGGVNATFVEDPDTFGRTLQCTSVSFWPTASQPAAALHTLAYSCLQFHTVACSCTQLHYTGITDVLIWGRSCSYATGCVTSCPVESGHRYAGLCSQAACVLFPRTRIATYKLCSIGSTCTQPYYRPVE